MAFMMPVMKNNYDIYKDSRSRKTSESSNGNANTPAASNSMSAAMGINNASRGRQRMKSESFASSPNHTYRMQMQRCQSQKTFPRNASRTSQNSSMSAALSPTRSFCQPSGSPPKNENTAAQQSGGSQNDISKFHLRLVDKLRKSFRKDNNKRSWKSTASKAAAAEKEQQTEEELLNLKAENLLIKPADSGLSSEHLGSSLNTSSCSSSITLKNETGITVEVTSYNDSSPNEVLSKENSCNNSPPSTETQPKTPTSLATHLGRRFNAGPLIKANIKKCHKKFTNFHLRPHYQGQNLDKKDNKLSSLSALELYNQDCCDHQLTKLDNKPLMKNMQKTSDTPACYVDKCNKKSPEKSAAGLRQARRRKRLSFMRRSTKSAPG